MKDQANYMLNNVKEPSPTPRRKEGYTFHELGEEQCKWTLPNGRFCGSHRVSLRPYCAEHLAIANPKRIRPGRPHQYYTFTMPQERKQKKRAAWDNALIEAVFGKE